MARTLQLLSSLLVISLVTLQPANGQTSDGTESHSTTAAVETTETFTTTSATGTLNMGTLSYKNASTDLNVTWADTTPHPLDDSTTSPTDISTLPMPLCCNQTMAQGSTRKDFLMDPTDSMTSLSNTLTSTGDRSTQASPADNSSTIGGITVTNGDTDVSTSTSSAESMVTSPSSISQNAADQNQTTLSPNTNATRDDGTKSTTQLNTSSIFMFTSAMVSTATSNVTLTLNRNESIETSSASPAGNSLNSTDGVTVTDSSSAYGSVSQSLSSTTSVATNHSSTTQTAVLVLDKIEGLQVVNSAYHEVVISWIMPSSSCQAITLSIRGINSDYASIESTQTANPSGFTPNGSTIALSDASMTNVLTSTPGMSTSSGSTLTVDTGTAPSSVTSVIPTTDFPSTITPQAPSSVVLDAPESTPIASSDPPTTPVAIEDAAIPLTTPDASQLAAAPVSTSSIFNTANVAERTSNAFLTRVDTNTSEAPFELIPSQPMPTPPSALPKAATVVSVPINRTLTCDANETIINLLPGQSHRISVSYSVNGSVESPITEVTHNVPDPGPLIYSVNVNGTSIVLSWPPFEARDDNYSTCAILAWDQNENGKTVICSGETFLPIEDAMPGDIFNISGSSEIDGVRSQRSHIELIELAPDEPQTFSAVTTGRSIALIWELGQGMRDKFTLTCTPDIVGQCGDLSNDATDLTLTNLDYGQAYSFTLVAVSNGLTSPGVTADASIAPDEPQTFSAGTTDRSIALTWDFGQGRRDKFTLTCTPDIAGQCGDLSNDATDLTLTNLDYGQAYSFTLVAVSNGLTSPGATADASIAAGVPTGLTTADGVDNQTQVLLSWTELENAVFDNYVITVTCVDGCQNSTLINVAKENTSTTASDLTPGQTYSFTIQTSKIDDSKSEQSPSQVHTTAPYAPVDVNLVGPTTSSGANITWTKKAGGVYSTNAPFSFELDPVNSLETGSISTGSEGNPILTLTSLSPYTNYTVKIFAVAQDGMRRTSALDFIFKTQEEAPGQVAIGDNNLAVSNSSVTVTWSPPDEPNGVILEYTVKVLLDQLCVSGYKTQCKSCANLTDSVEIESCNMALPVGTFDSATASFMETLKGLEPNTNYGLVVYTSNSAGTSSTPRQNFSTNKVAPSDAPELQDVTGGPFSLLVSWKQFEPPGGDVALYQIQYRRTDGNDSFQDLDHDEVEVNQVNLTDLKPYTEYALRIRAATNVSGELKYGPWSANSTYLTSPYIPGGPPEGLYAYRMCRDSWMSDGLTVLVYLYFAPPNEANGRIEEYQVVWMSDNDTETQVVPPFLGGESGGSSLMLKAVNNLKPNKEFNVSVSARTTYVDPSDNSTWGPSAHTNFTTIQAGPENKVDQLSVLQVTRESIQIQWKPVESENGDVVGHRIRVNMKVEDVNLTLPADFSQMVTYNITSGIFPATNYNLSVTPYAIAPQCARDRDEIVLSPTTPDIIKAITNDSVPMSMPISKEDRVEPSSSETDRFSFKLPNADVLFDSSNGMIQRYQLVVYKMASEHDVPSLENGFGLGKNFPTWKQWTDENANGGYAPYGSRSWPESREASRKKRATESEEIFTIGEQSQSDCNNGGYCNGPLRDDSRYCVYARGWTKAGYADSNCFVVVKLEKNNTVLYIIVAVVVVLALLALVGVLVYLHRRNRLPSCDGKRDGDGSMDMPLDSRPSPYADHPMPQPVHLSDFIPHVQEMHKDQDFRFSNDYQRIREISPRHSTDNANLSCNTPKNRYVDILPFDHSRVKLLPADEEEGSDYINANFMPGFTSRREYIACQGSLPGTVDHFWRMVWEQNVSTIVMLTQPVERGRSKCVEYWPDGLDEPSLYGDIVITQRSESVLPDYTIRIFDLEHDELSRTVKWFFVSFWPDFGCPEKTDNLTNLTRVVRSHLSSDSKGPVLVHCSAGVGRTGTYIAVDRLLQEIQVGETVDIFNLVLEMRDYRCRMVQTEDQYIYIHDCLRDALLSGLSPYYKPAVTDSTESDEPVYENEEIAVYENQETVEELRRNSKEQTNGDITPNGDAVEKPAEMSELNSQESAL